MTITKLTEEMVKNAANQIGWEYDDSTLEQVLNDLYNNYEIVLNDDAPIDHNAVSVICECIHNWQHETQQNFM